MLYEKLTQLLKIISTAKTEQLLAKSDIETAKRKIEAAKEQEAFAFEAVEYIKKAQKAREEADKYKILDTCTYKDKIQETLSYENLAHKHIQYLERISRLKIKKEKKFEEGYSVGAEIGQSDFRNSGCSLDLPELRIDSLSFPPFLINIEEIVKNCCIDLTKVEFDWVEGYVGGYFKAFKLEKNKTNF